MDNKPPNIFNNKVYDSFIDIFLKMGNDKFRIELEGMDSDILKAQLNTRINARNLDNKIRIIIFNDSIYLTKQKVLFKTPASDPSQ